MLARSVSCISRSSAGDRSGRLVVSVAVLIGAVFERRGVGEDTHAFHGHIEKMLRHRRQTGEERFDSMLFVAEERARFSRKEMRKLGRRKNRRDARFLWAQMVCTHEKRARFLAARWTRITLFVTSAASRREKGVGHFIRRIAALSRGEFRHCDGHLRQD